MKQVRESIYGAEDEAQGRSFFPPLIFFPLADVTWVGETQQVAVACAR